MKVHFDTYLFNLSLCLQTISFSEVNKLVDLITENSIANKTIFTAGNGGSATTAEHMATDLMNNVKNSFFSIRAICLSSNISNITATANDLNYENIFSRQLDNLGSPNDLLIVLSASGNSPNLVSAVKTAKKIGLKTVGILGFDGGTLKNIVDHSVHVQTKIGEYGFSEDAHLILNHMLINLLKKIVI